MLKNFRLFAAKSKKCKLLLCLFKGCWEFDIFVIVSNFVFRISDLTEKTEVFGQALITDNAYNQVNYIKLPQV